MAWYNANWDYRVKVTVKATQVSADLTGFPVYVNLANLPAGFHTNVNQTDARDIRVTTADGTTEVPREVVLYTAATNTGEMYFKGSIDGDTDTDFYIYYGNASATEPAEDATYGRENVWDSNYQAVYHLGGLIDSTSNDRDLTNVNTTDGVGKIGGGKEHSGTGQYLTGADIAFGGTSPITVSAWCEPDSVTGNHNLVAQGTEVVLRGVNATMQFILNTFTTTSDRITTGNVLTINTWAYICGTYSSANGMKIFVNGSSSTSGTPSGNYANVAANFDIGRLGNDSEHFDGVLDEARISSIDRGADWIATEYSNQNAPASFYDVGAEETGSTDANSERSLYISGVTSTNSSRGLWIQGSLTNNSERGLYLEGLAPVENWLNGWDYRVKITVLASEVDANISNFPVYVDLSDLPAGFHTNVNSTDARDIRVTSSDGETELPREVVFYSAASDTGELHFKATSLSSTSDNDFYIYYGNSSATEPAIDSTYGAENVWSIYEAVYHFQNSLLDSTTNDHDLTDIHTADSSSGKLGNGRAFDSDALSVALDLSGTAKVTVSRWYNQTNLTGAQVQYEFTNNFNNSTGGMINYTDSATYYIGHKGSGYNIAVATMPESGAFKHLVEVRDKSAAASLECLPYLNGSIMSYSKASYNSENTGNFANDTLYIGGRAGSSLWGNGVLDEFRLLKDTLSAEWISTEYSNQSAPDSFYDVGTQEEPSAGGTEANDERLLYISGKTTGNSERSLYISGTTTSNSERLIYLSGSQTLSTSYFNIQFGLGGESNSERLLYTEGKLTDSSERLLHIEGKISSFSERGLYLIGNASTNSERGLYAEGKVDDSSERGLYTVGVATSSLERLLYIEGKNSDSSERLIYTQGKTTDSSERLLHISGSVSTNGEVSIYTSGLATTNSNRLLYIQGTLDTYSERGLYINCVPVNDERGLWISGKEGGERRLYIEGSGGGWSERSLWTKGIDTGYSIRSLYIEGSIALFSERAIYTEGYATDEKEISIRISGKDTDSSERTLRLQGKTTSSNERLLYLQGSKDTYSEISLYIFAICSFDERRLHIQGKGSESSERGIYTAGVSDSSSDRNLYTQGSRTPVAWSGLYDASVMPEEFNPIFSTGTLGTEGINYDIGIVDNQLVFNHITGISRYALEQDLDDFDNSIGGAVEFRVKGDIMSLYLDIDPLWVTLQYHSPGNFEFLVDDSSVVIPIDTSDFRTIKLTGKGNVGRLYVDGELVYEMVGGSGVGAGWNGIGADFQLRDATIDYIYWSAEGTEAEPITRELYLVGCISVGDERGLYLSGISSSYSVRGLYLYGKLTGSSQRVLWLKGSIASERAIYLIGAKCPWKTSDKEAWKTNAKEDWKTDNGNSWKQGDAEKWYNSDKTKYKVGTLRPRC